MRNIKHNGPRIIGLVFAILILSYSTAVLAQDCLRYERVLHRTDVITANSNYPASTCVIVDDYLYLERTFSLWVYDISDPWAAEFVTTLPDVGNIKVVEAQGTLLYILNSYGIIKVVDISDPEAPFMRGTLDVGGEDMDIDGSWAYVASGVNGLKIVDLSNPDALAVVGALPDVYIFKVATRRGYVYGLDYYVLGPFVVDARSPSAPQYVDVINDAPSNSAGIEIGKGFLYLATGSDLLAFDLSIPRVPALAGAVPRPSPPSGLISLLARGNRLFLVEDDFCHFVDIDTPTQPVFSGTIPADDYDMLPGLGETAFAIVESLHRIAIYNRMTLAPNPPAAFLDLGGSHYKEIATWENLAVVGSNDDMLVVDLSIPETPAIVATIPTDSQVRDIFCQDDLVFAACDDGVRIVNIAAPSSPVPLSHLPVVPAMAVTTVGNHLFTWGGGQGLQAYEISDPENPQFVGQNGLFSCKTIFSSGSLIYGAGYNEFQIVDASDPVNCPIIGQMWELDSNVQGLAVDFPYAFVAGSGDIGLIVVDVNNPLELEVVAENPIKESFGIVLDGDFAYLGHEHPGGFSVLDITTPPTPANIGGLALPAETQADVFEGAPLDNHVVWAAHWGIVVTSRQCTGVTDVSDGNTGAEIPTRKRPVLTASPNPFNPMTILEFELPMAQHTRLSVYQADGRLVDTLVDSELTAGKHRLIWKGKDAYGRSLPSGVFFCRLVSGDEAVTQKIVMIR